MSKNLNVFSAAYGLLINGEWTKPGDLLESVNPANGQLLAKFTDATEADVNAAVAAAQDCRRLNQRQARLEAQHGHCPVIHSGAAGPRRHGEGGGPLLIITW